MDISINPTHCVPQALNKTPVVVRTLVQYRESDSDAWVDVSQTSQRVPEGLSTALRTPGGVAVTTQLHAQQQKSDEVDPLALANLDSFYPLVQTVGEASDEPSLSLQDEVMKAIDEKSTPGYLTVEVLEHLTRMSRYSCIDVFFFAAQSGFTWNRCRVKRDYLPQTIKKIESSDDAEISQKRNLLCSILSAVVLDEEVRGPIRDELVVAKDALAKAKATKRAILPSDFSSQRKDQWVNDDSKVRQYTTKVDELEQFLRLLPSQRAEAKGMAAEELLIDL